MKAHPKLNRFLRESKFGYFSPTYIRVHNAGRHGETIQIDRQKAGLMITLETFYFCSGQIFPVISPNEIRVIWTDGTVAGSGGSAAYWKPSDVVGMLDAISTVGFAALDKLSEPDLMVQVYENLIEDNGRSPARLINEFPPLGEASILRKRTPVRVLNLAAYLNLACRFDAAREIVERYRRTKSNFFQRKVLEDSKAKRVTVPRESLDFLRSVGATVPDSVYGINEVN